MARRTAQNEAGSVGEIYLLAEQLPEPDRREIQGLTESYARTVVEDGWPMMEQGRASVRAQTIGVELRRSVMAFEPSTNAEQALHVQGLTLVQDFDQYRALRLLEVREGIPTILWVVLILGGGHHDRLHLPLRDGGAAASRADGRRPDRATRHGPVHDKGAGIPFYSIVQVEPEPFEIVLEMIETGRVL